MRTYKHRHSPKRVQKRAIRGEDILWFAMLAIVICIIVLALNGASVDVHDEIVEVGTEYQSESTITWLGMDFSDRVRVNGEVNTKVVGTYTLEYYFLGKTYIKNVSVVDTTKPIFILIGEETVEVSLSIDEFVDPGFYVVDNYDEDLTSQVKTHMEQVGNTEYVVTYSVSDSSGNFSQIERHVKVKVGTVYLTFDDGPSSTVTPQVLDILEKNDITATFFLVGYSSGLDEIVLREYSAGHTIGLHGYSHVYSEIYTSVDALMENFQKISDQVYETTGGYRSEIIRFPGGSSNTVSRNFSTGIMTLAVQTVADNGYKYFDWNVDSCDAGGADKSEQIYQNVTQTLKPGNNIVLMHDSGGHQATVDALQKIIDYCRENGYDFKPIDSETPEVHHGIAN
ncbi:MAG: polysaccharide deacetylase [Clostridia bacterium]|nr:polysaccharide deacetylase [Clostridia bacterium]